MGNQQEQRSPEWLKGHCVQSWGLLREHLLTCACPQVSFSPRATTKHTGVLSDLQLTLYEKIRNVFDW